MLSYACRQEAVVLGKLSFGHFNLHCGAYRGFIPIAVAEISSPHESIWTALNCLALYSKFQPVAMFVMQ
jgi:hypothetical protein